MTRSNDPFDFLWRDDWQDDAADSVDGLQRNGQRAQHDEVFDENSLPLSMPSMSMNLDAFFDDDLSESQSEILYAHIEREHQLADDLLGTQRAIEALRATPACPDLSQRILQQVDRKRGLMSGPWFKRMVVSRVAIAAVLLLAVGSVFALHGFSSQLANLGQPTPIGQIASALPLDASRSTVQRSEPASASLPSRAPAPSADGAAGANNNAAAMPSSWALRFNLHAAAAESRAAVELQAMQTVMNAGPEGRIAVVRAGEMDPLGDSIELLGAGSSFGAASSGAVLRVASSGMPAECASLQGMAIVRDTTHEQAFQACLREALADEAAAAEAPIVIPAIAKAPAAAAPTTIAASTSQLIVTDECVHFMGHTVDRQTFHTLLAGFGSVTPTSLGLGQ